MRRKVAAIAALSLLGAGSLGVGIRARLAQPQAEPTSAAILSNPVAATLSVGTSLSVRPGQTVLISVDAAGPTPLRQVDLYDGPNLVDQAPVKPGRKGATLSWVALRPGAHSLVALVRGTDGNTGQTQAHTLVVEEPYAAVATPPTVSVRAGETAGSLLTRLQGADVLVPDPARPAPALTASTTTSGPLTSDPMQPAAKVDPAKPVPPVGNSPLADPGTQPPTDPAAFPAWASAKGWVPASSLAPTAVLAPGLAFLDPKVLAGLAAGSGMPPAAPPSAPPAAPTAAPATSAAPSGPSGSGGAWVLPPLTVSYPIVSYAGAWVPPAGGPSSPPSTPAPASSPPSGPTVANGLTISDVELAGCKIFLKLSGTQNAKTDIAVTSTSRPLPAVIYATTNDGMFNLDIPPGAKTILARSGNRVSAPIGLVSAGCTGTTTGTMSLVDGILTLPEEGGNVFLYLVADGYQAVRVPAAPQATLKVGRISNVAAYLPNVAHTTKGHLEAWRQVGTTATKFAEAEVTGGFADIVGQPSAATLEMELGSGAWGTIDTDDTAPAPKTFRWTTASAQVQNVLWQVLRYPLSPANTELTPAGTLAVGIASRTGSPSSFTVQAKDLDPTPAPGTPGAATATSGSGGSNPTAQAGGWAVGPNPSAVSQLVAKTSTSGGTSLSPQALSSVFGPGGDQTVSDAELEQFLQAMTAGVNGRVYIRIIGLGPDGSPSGFGPIGAASNLVAYDPPAAAVAVGPRFALTNSSALVGWRPNEDLRGCIRVTQVPWTGRLLSGKAQLTVPQPTAHPLSVASMSEFYPVPGMYCPGDFGVADDCDLWCQLNTLGDLAATIWDKVAAAYNGIIDGASSLVADYNPICLGIGSLSSDEAATVCREITKVAAATAIAAVLQSFGLPPSLPTSDQLIKLGQGKVEDAAMAGLTALGIPCDDLTVSGVAEDKARELAAKNDFPMPDEGEPVGVCEVLVHAAVQTVRDKAEEEMTKTFVESSGLPNDPSIVGLTIIPEPRAWMPPAIITATLVVDPATIPADVDRQGLTVSIPVAGSGYHYGSGTIVLYYGPARTVNLGAAGSYSQPEGWFGVIAVPALRQESVIYGTSETFTLTGTAVDITGIPKVVGAYWPF